MDPLAGPTPLPFELKNRFGGRLYQSIKIYLAPLEIHTQRRPYYVHVQFMLSNCLATPVSDLSKHECNGVYTVQSFQFVAKAHTDESAAKVDLIKSDVQELRSIEVLFLHGLS